MEAKVQTSKYGGQTSKYFFENLTSFSSEPALTVVTSMIAALRYYPLLLVPNVDDCRNPITTDRELVPYNIAEGKAYTNVRLQVPFHKRCCGSSHGWLASVEKINQHGRPRFRKPTAHSSLLPCVSLLIMRQYEYYVPKVLSADPLPKRLHCLRGPDLLYSDVIFYKRQLQLVETRDWLCLI
ncbi:hypothetical protein EV2_020796 [Malus domestica]